jgi:hypothetical protein
MSSVVLTTTSGYVTVLHPEIRNIMVVREKLREA